MVTISYGNRKLANQIAFSEICITSKKSINYPTQMAVTNSECFLNSLRCAYIRHEWYYAPESVFDANRYI